jgi:nucleoid-associated protein YgaU
MFALRIPLAICALAVAAFLAVPRPGGAGPEEQYVVRAGDTLWELAAARYGGDPREGVWHIRRRNSLDARTLQPGMVLYLPAGAGGA